jgi:hypothetical protein
MSTRVRSGAGTATALFSSSPISTPPTEKMGKNNKGKKTPATGTQTPATAPADTGTPVAPQPEVPAVVGINFGNSYASIAVISKVRCPDVQSNKILC